MKIQWAFGKRGITLIELLVALVISGVVIGAIYNIFIAQTKAYTVQDQVVEVQQSTRSAMEIMLRDLRMAGFDDNSLASPIVITNPIGAFSDNSITVNYEYYDTSTLQYQTRTVTYFVDGTNLHRQETITPAVGTVSSTDEIILDNVNALNFTYGVDGINGFEETQDGAIDDRNSDGIINENDFLVSAADVNGGNLKVIAARIVLTARPEKLDAKDDRFKMVSPRTLVSAVTLRNLCLIKKIP
jgi:prepilin-type N-terminal cleavage/methylation domain-containing protein